MAYQPIDKFCETLDPVVKNAVTLASVGSTVAREKILNQAYPEAGKTEHLRELANRIKSLRPSENLGFVRQRRRRGAATHLKNRQGKERQKRRQSKIHDDRRNRAEPFS